jgi:transposase
VMVLGVRRLGHHRVHDRHVAVAEGPRRPAGHRYRRRGAARLLLSSDFYTVYQSLRRLNGVDNLWCWSHIRRYFIRAGDAHLGHRAVLRRPEHHRAHRTAQGPIQICCHPAAAKVLATLDREWDGLTRHREFPELALDNTSERALRGPVVGRATAGRAGLNPLTYLTACLDECARAGGTAPTDQALTRFLPWAAGTDDLTAWANGPQPNPDTPRARHHDRERRPFRGSSAHRAAS